MMVAKGCLACLLKGDFIWISGYGISSAPQQSQARTRSCLSLHGSSRRSELAARDETYRIRLDLRQCRLTGRPDDLHNLHQLIIIVSPAEERVTSNHLGHTISCQRQLDD